MNSYVESDANDNPPPKSAGPVVIPVAGSIFAAHLVLAVGWWMLTPKGFPLTHGRFWLNSVLPPTAALAVCLGLFGLIRRRPAISATLMLCLSVIWAVATLAGTSVGRGWETVGHRSGTYRNRMQIEAAAE